MQQNGAMLTVACLMLCLTFNYTFPLRRESSNWNRFANHTTVSEHYCDKKHNENVVDPKKIAAPANTEKALQILTDSSNVNTKSKKQTKITDTKNNDEDLRHFEQMVIKKKNPYLDLKELELRYYNPKNTRQSVDPGPIVQDPSLCESLEEGPNVEITNRGLSGFAIPSKLLNGATLAEIKIKTENPSNNGEAEIKTIEISPKEQSDHSNRDTQLLETLEDDIRQFEETRYIKII